MVATKVESLMKLLFMFVALMELCSHLAMAGTSVKYLPGFDGKLPFQLKTGYIGVRQSEEVQLFYYFIKSESNPKVDPLILWLDGGPGCSTLTSIANVIGPLRFDGREYNGSLPTLSYHPYGYTQVANIIFIDYPVGTGFSYAKTQNANHSDTIQASEDVHEFLLKWLVENPKYLSNPFYVGGVSFGGIFGPIVTKLISDGIEAGIQPRVNLKGYIFGNPATDLPGRDSYKISFAHAMGLIPDELHKSIVTHCGGESEVMDLQNPSCAQNFATYKELVTGVFQYHILEPVCNSTSTKVQMTSPINLPGMKCRINWWELSNFWARNNAVQEALHVRKGTIGVWEFCNINLPLTRSINNTVPYHVYLSTKNYRSLIYNGDHDMAVPHQATQAWMRSLNYSIIVDWKAWTFDDQIAGYTRTYSNGMTYASMKGSGHTPPETNPAQCLAMLKRWLSHKSL